MSNGNRIFAIRVRYLGPTNTRGARIRAEVLSREDFKPVTAPYDYAAHNHARAALEALARENGRDWTFSTHPVGSDGDRGDIWLAMEGDPPLGLGW